MTRDGITPVGGRARHEYFDSRLVTILFAGLCDMTNETWSARDTLMERSAARLLSLLEIIVTRDEAGQVLQSGSDSVCATFGKASDAINRALEIQRVVEGFLADPQTSGKRPGPRVRIGLHMGEVLLREGERVEIVSRQVIRARRVMETAGPGQIYASEGVIEAGRDFLAVPRESLTIRSYGEYHLAGSGVVALGEVADLRFCSPAPPRMPESERAESARLGRLELAGYQALRRVGEGAMGVTYQGIEEASGRKVAIKALASSFLQEAGEEWKAGLDRQVERASHGPFINDNDGGGALPVVLAWRLDHQPPFLVREWMEGLPLDEALKNAQPERVAQVFLHLCELLASGHSHGLVHSNLKPGNVLVRPDDGVVALDWALGQSLEGRPLNPPWSAPEQIQGQVAGPPADIYSVGTLLFKALAGREPFQGNSLQHIWQAHLHDDPNLPSAFQAGVPDPLQRICLKALEKSPTERYSKMSDMAEDLKRFLRREPVRTRPTAYDNLLFHRVARHIGQVREWRAQELLNVEESNRLLAAYEGLRRRGIPAAMESKVYPFWQILVYIGGWAVVNGALLWLALHWSELGRAQKLLLGSLPAAVAFILGYSMMRMERYRLAFVAYVVGVLAAPLVAGVWLHEFGIAALIPPELLAQELFYGESKISWLTNGQIFWSALFTAGIAISISYQTRTTTHSAQATAASALLYASILLFYGLKSHVQAGQWAVLGLQSIPLLALMAGCAAGLLCWPDRQHQAEPWIYGSTVLVLAILYALALQGLEQWTSLPENDRRPAALLLLSIAGVLEAGLGLAARGWLKHRGRTAVLLLVVIGLGNLLGGLVMAGWKETWPAAWPSGTLFGQTVPLPHLILPVVSILIALLACRFQMFSFLGMGLVGFAGGVHLLGDLYFKEAAAWPRWIMLGGVACFVVALYAELRRARHLGPIDTVSQSRL